MHVRTPSSRSRKVRVAALAFALVATFAPIERTQATETVTQSRAVTGFDRVRLRGAFETEIVAGARGTHVRLSGDPAALARVTTEVRDGELVIETTPGFENPGAAIRAAVAVPSLRALASEGAGTTHVRGIAGGDFAIDGSGANAIVASGRATRERIALSGAGSIDVSGVDARDVVVSSSGAGSIRVRARASLAITASGVARIRYVGNPSHVENHVSGLASVERI